MCEEFEPMKNKGHNTQTEAKAFINFYMLLPEDNLNDSLFNVVLVQRLTETNPILCFNGLRRHDVSALADHPDERWRDDGKGCDIGFKIYGIKKSSWWLGVDPYSAIQNNPEKSNSIPDNGWDNNHFRGKQFGEASTTSDYYRDCKKSKRIGYAGLVHNEDGGGLTFDKLKSWLSSMKEKSKDLKSIKLIATFVLINDRGSYSDSASKLWFLTNAVITKDPNESDQLQKYNITEKEVIGENEDQVFLYDVNEIINEELFWIILHSVYKQNSGVI